MAALAIVLYCGAAPDFPAFAQPISACGTGMQLCPSGQSGWGGCFKASESRCINGMVCEQGEEFCSPNANSPGGCYNPKEATCTAGQVCDIGWSACPAGAKGIGGCYRPQVAECQAGLVCGKDELNCGAEASRSAETAAPPQQPDRTVAEPMTQPAPGQPTATAPLPSWPAPKQQNSQQQSVPSQPSATPSWPSPRNSADSMPSGAAPVAASCGTATAGDRRDMLEIVRGTVAQALRQPVEFKVRTARVCGNWGFVMAEPQRPGGGAIQWSRTVCRGDTSHLVGALTQRDGSGTWRLVDHALCPSDVAWSDWPDKYGVPEQIFGE
ncbi:MAG TPA: hypothetical protein VFC32_03005 [Pseudolabrys sp.]|nr:hypothetical protein [Pseudolabrys sp.]